MLETPLQLMRLGREPRSSAGPTGKVAVSLVNSSTEAAQSLQVEWNVLYITVQRQSAG